ncbi:alpha-N-acetylglucosaminidase C-terminal domain-containing protein [Fulvivirgaceae bacterium PWU5]|uniref:Alpha-N-acetylglucosaminidase C-terminal domain-containing protein n=1 Tax=Dawidia cretensis TaxID=2782350 RepID=A0AAP2E194_9BACT|nr:alpha-N-acetylglucosaminidase C-terminal domain-containing protein [Dawidia cretensis]MBT1709669.1 alpha-N-acetylglucosaminidase C-terminal domain-containing protein [Dawidia cretensis]
MLTKLDYDPRELFRAWAIFVDHEQDLYEFNARDLITLWGDKESKLHEYSTDNRPMLLPKNIRPCRWAIPLLWQKHSMQSIKTGWLRSDVLHEHYSLYNVAIRSSLELTSRPDLWEASWLISILSLPPSM